MLQRALLRTAEIVLFPVAAVMAGTYWVGIGAYRAGHWLSATAVSAALVASDAVRPSRGAGSRRGKVKLPDRGS